MADETNPRAVVGGNNPPAFDADQVAKFEEESQDFLDAAGAWLDLKTISTDAKAEELADFVTGCKKRKKAIDEARKAEKKPHDDRGKEVQAAYTPILEKLDRAIQRVGPLQEDFLRRKREKEQEEARKAREEADRQRREAEEAAREAEARNDVSGEVDAEAAAKEARKAERTANKLSKQRTTVKSATGGGRASGLRTYYEVAIDKPATVFMRYKDHPRMQALLQELAQAEVRSAAFDVEKDTIAGATITKKEKWV